MTLEEKNSQRIAFAKAHHDLGKGLNSYAFFKIHNHETGEDLVQATFIKTWKYLVRGGKIEIMKAFLYHVLNDLIVDEYRKHKTASLDVLMEKGFSPSIDTTERLSNYMDGKSAFLLMQRLPVKYKKILEMRYLKELSLKEMSLITGQSVNNLSVQSHRALAKLRLLYKK